MVFIRPQKRQTEPCGLALLLHWVHSCFIEAFVFVLTADSALDDFLLTHPVFIPNSQLCPVLMAQYPLSCTFCPFWRLVKRIDLCPLLLLSSLTLRAPTTPRPRRAANRRGWTTRSTTSAGWSAWWCSGPPCTETACRMKRSQWPFCRSEGTTHTS